MGHLGSKLWIFCAYLAVLTAGVVEGAPVTACSNLGAAISAAGSGGTVQISGILTCSSVTTISTSITLVGVSSNPSLDGFDGQSSTSLFMVQGSGVKVSFKYLQLKNAKGTSGAALFVDTGASVSLSNFLISNSYTDAGAGAAAYIKGTAQFSSGTISGSSSNYAGGAIFEDGGATVSYTNVQFKNNQVRSGRGGCVYVSGGTRTTFTSVTADGCTASDDGGAIFAAVGTADVLKFTGSTFKNSVAGNDGGCMYIFGDIKPSFNGGSFQNCTATTGQGGAINMGSANAVTSFTSTIFVGNQAYREGGAIFIQTDTSISTFNGVSFTNNQCTRVEYNGNTIVAVANVGALWANGDVTLAGVTMTGNVASGSGGGIGTQADIVRVSDCDIEGNKARFSGGGIYTMQGQVQIERTLWHKSSNNTDQTTIADGSRDVFINEGGFVFFCDALPWPSNSPHTVSGGYSLGCPGYNGTQPINANRDCVSFLTALKNAPAGGTVNFTDLVRFDSTTCGSFKLPFVISKSVTIVGASANPLYNTLDAFNDAAIFRIRGSGTRVYMQLLQLTRGNGVNGPAIYMEAGTFLQLNQAYLTHHTATGNGGALFLEAGASVEILSSSLTYNTATNGGAIYASDASKVYLYTCTFQYNSATTDGGTLWQAGRLDSSFTTMSDSSAGGNGGCIRQKASSNAQLDGGSHDAGFFKICTAVQGGALYIQGTTTVVQFMTWYNNGASKGDNSTNAFVTKDGLLETCPEPTLFNKPKTIVGPYTSTCPGSNPDVATTCADLITMLNDPNPPVYSWAPDNPAIDPPVPTIRVSSNIEITSAACPDGTKFPLVIGKNIKNLRILGDDNNPQFNTITGKGLNPLFKVTSPYGVKFERLWLTLGMRKTGDGACVEHTQGKLTILNVNLQDCIAKTGRGGAIYLGPGTSADTTSFASLRSFGTYGGALYAESGVSVSASGSGFFQGGSYKSGGGVYVAGPFSVQLSSIVQNTAGDYGAGLYAVYPAKFTWFTGSIDSNTAQLEGGAAYFGPFVDFLGRQLNTANNQVQNQPKNPKPGSQTTSAVGYLDQGADVILCQYGGQSSDQNNENTTDSQFFKGPGIFGLTIYKNINCTNAVSTKKYVPPKFTPTPANCTIPPGLSTAKSSASPPPPSNQPVCMSSQPPPPKAVAKAATLTAQMSPPKQMSHSPPLMANQPPNSPPQSANPPPNVVKPSKNPPPNAANPPPSRSQNPPPNTLASKNPPPTAAKPPPPARSNPPPKSANPPPKLASPPPPASKNPPPITAKLPPPQSVNPPPKAANPPPKSINPPPKAGNPPPPLSVNPPPKAANPPPPLLVNPPPKAANPPPPQSLNPPPKAANPPPSLLGNPPPRAAKPPPPQKVNPPPKAANPPPPRSANPPPNIGKPPPPFSVNPPPNTAKLPPPLSVNPPPKAANPPPPRSINPPPKPANPPPAQSVNPPPKAAIPPPHFSINPPPKPAKPPPPASLNPPPEAAKSPPSQLLKPPPKAANLPPPQAVNPPPKAGNQPPPISFLPPPTSIKQPPPRQATQQPPPVSFNPPPNTGKLSPPLSANQPPPTFAKAFSQSQLIRSANPPPLLQPAPNPVLSPPDAIVAPAPVGLISNPPPNAVNPPPFAVANPPPVAVAPNPAPNPAPAITSANPPPVAFSPNPPPVIVTPNPPPPGVSANPAPAETTSNPPPLTTASNPPPNVIATNPPPSQVTANPPPEISGNPPPAPNPPPDQIFTFPPPALAPSPVISALPPSPFSPPGGLPPTDTSLPPPPQNPPPSLFLFPPPALMSPVEAPNPLPTAPAPYNPLPPPPVVTPGAQAPDAAVAPAKSS